MELIEKTERYFMLFSTKNLDELEELYSDNITLIDWNGEWHGKQSVLDMNKTLFENNIRIDYHRIGYSNLTTYGQITIKVNETKLKVIDVIDWTTDGKILKIEAYKR
jgi:hypothetical protein